MDINKFYLACKQKNIGLARQEISNADDVNICVTNYEGRYGDEPVSYTALEWAIFCGVAEVAELLLQKNARITSKAFLLAEKNKRNPVFKLLLGKKKIKKKASFLKSADTPTALSWAAHIGDLSLVSSLLEEGADVNKLSEAMGTTPLIEAVRENHISIVKLLLEKGADINATDVHKRTALMYAALTDNSEITELLLKNKADVNFTLSGETALIIAAKCSHRKIIRLLSEHKADINAKDSLGQTAIFKAAINKDFKTVRLLRRLGAFRPKHIVDEYGRQIPGYQNVLIEASRKGHFNKVKELVNKGTNINAADHEGLTALMRAAANNRKNIVEFLLQNKAKTDLTDKQGKTALIYATTNEYPDIVSLLLKNGADINQNGSTGTALNNAAKWGYTDLVKLLLKAGADVHLKDNKGNTALDNARENGHLEIVKILQTFDNK